MRINFGRQLKAKARMIAHQAGYAERLGAHRDRPWHVGFEPDILRHGKASARQLRQMRDQGIDKRQAVGLLQHTLSACERNGAKLFPGFDQLPESRRAVLVSLLYFGGEKAVRASAAGKKLLDALAEKDFAAAGEYCSMIASPLPITDSMPRISRQMRLGRWVDTKRNSTPDGWPRG